MDAPSNPGCFSLFLHVLTVGSHFEARLSESQRPASALKPGFRDSELDDVLIFDFFAADVPSHPVGRPPLG